MEFTPKKQVIPKYSPNCRAPYTVGGPSSYKRLKKSFNHTVSPRPSHVVRSPQSYPGKRFLSRTERIVHLSKKIGQGDDATTAPDIKTKTSPQSNKRPFSAVNTVEGAKEQTFLLCPDKDIGGIDGRKKPNDENDPYNFSSSHDFEIFDKRPKKYGSQDALTWNSPRVSIKSYSSKKKQLDLSRSKLLVDVSPEKVEKAYGPKFKSAAEKENVPAETSAGGESVPLPEPVATLPHLIGFANYGNTCYLNSVVQSLFGLPPFVEDLQLVGAQLNLPSTSLSSGLIQIVGARLKGQVAGVKQSLKTVKENLVRVDDTFSGYKMQDANEFLTRALDTIKDEIDRCHMTTPSPDRSLTCKEDDLDEVFPSSAKCQKLTALEENFDGEINITAKSRLTPRNTDDQDSDLEDLNACDRVLPGSEIENQNLTSSSQTSTPNKSCDEEVLPRNPVKDNFEFQLLESYRCLGCNEVVGRKQDYFGLYVNPPEESQGTIQDALSSCMGEDKRELKCESCGHGLASVVTTVTALPRILIVQLKRYEYKADQGESVKRAWRVPVTRWLALDDYVLEGATGPSSWRPHSGSIVPKSSKQTTLTVRNLSSELNVFEGKKEQEEVPGSASGSPKSQAVIAAPPPPSSSSDKEDEELQEVMLRSMDDVGGTREEDEIQQAIKLSLQDLGMSYTHENQSHSNDDQGEEESLGIAVLRSEEESKINSSRHAYRLISVISHFGCTTNTGHYVADVYNCEEESWFHYDDESVSKIPESVVLAEGRQKNGYIFFYMHKDVLQNIEKSSR